jgi:alpha-ketoglutarate-dependent taurine dioxygenase
MQKPYIINYKNIQDIKDNVSTYFKDFIDNSVICFRGGKVSLEEQIEILTIFGDHSGWFPNTEDLKDNHNLIGFEKNSFYREDHERVLPDNKGNQDTIITWHIEHSWRKNPTVAGIWNMHVFTCNEEDGKTLFVDTNKVWDMISNEDKDFLNKSTSYIYAVDGVNGPQKNETPCVKPHWYTKKDIIDIDLYYDSSRQYLVSYEGNMPTEDQINNFRRIQNFVLHQVQKNYDLRIVHKWQQGDVLIPDLHKLAHTVTGGFKPEQRYFEGIWAALNKYD